MKIGLLKKVGLIGSFLLIISNSFAQVNNYVYNTTTGNVLEAGPFTNLLGTGQDDGVSAVTPIGFNFNYGGTVYTDFSVSSNGLVRLGPITVVNAWTNDILGTGAVPNLAAWWDDQETGLDGNVQYKLTGTSPNQKLVIEWNTHSYNSGIDGNFDKTYQVWLFETTNAVMFVYGAGIVPVSSSVFISTNGASDFQSVTTSSNTVSLVTQDNANATWPGSGRAYSFTPPPFDAEAVALAAPLTTGCYTSADSVILTIGNNGANPLDFSVNNAVVTVDVTGAVTQTLTTTLVDNTLNGGMPLAPGATLNVFVGFLDMTTPGTYTFDGDVSAGDPVPSNDAIAATNRLVSGGIIAVSNHTHCNGDNVTLSLTGNTDGTIQWQDSIPGGSWNNISGGTTNPYIFNPSDSAFYRAVVCGNLYSTIDSVNIVTVGDPTVNDTTRCGAGTVSLTANGVGTMNWYDSPSGGSLLYSGNTFTTNVSSDTTFYVAASSSTGGSTTIPLPAEVTTFTGNVRGMWFTAPTGFTITGLQAPGTGSQSITVVRFNPAVAPPFFATTTNAFDVLYLTQNNPATGVIPVSITINSGDIIGVMSQRGTTVSYANSPASSTIGGMPVTLSRLGMQFPLTTTAPQDLWQEAGGSIGRTEITYQVGCESFRIPADVTVIPATPISLNITDTTICDVDTIALTATSANPSYTYSWTPSATLSSPTGSTVNAFPVSNITYVVNALDTAGCAISDTVDVLVNMAPTATMMVSPTTICFGDSITLTGSNNTGGGTYNMTGPIIGIPDSNPTGARDTIVVSGAQNSLLSGDIVSVCINMTHTWDSDLDIYLVSPLGTQIELSTDNGGSGDNYTSTCFDMTAATAITAGAAPFTGSFIPEGTFDAFNGENANGNWQLFVVDDLGGDIGTINSWSITFNSFNYPITWSSVPVGFSDTLLVTGDAPTVTTTYVMGVTDLSNGCTREYFEEVTVNPLPVVTLGPDTAICSNYAGITLDGTNAGAGTYLWQDGQSGATYFASLPGTYSLEVTDTNGCVGSDDVVVGTIAALVVSIDANLTGIHDADLDAGPGFASYDWSTTATTQVINVNTNGTYYVTCVDNNGCVSTDSLSIVFSLGTFNPNGTETTLQLYPNPSEGVFSLSINNLETSDLVIEVVDMNGRVITNRVVGSVAGSTIEPFSLTDLRAGTYNLRVIANGKTSTLRFVISK